MFIQFFFLLILLKATDHRMEPANQPSRNSFGQKSVSYKLRLLPFGRGQVYQIVFLQSRCKD